MFKPDYEIVCAEGGQAALGQMDHGAFDLVISDIRMPEMDGLELLMRIRERDADVPVIMLTGFGSLETAQKAVRRGANDYLKKPFDSQEMRRAVRQHIERSKLAARRREVMEQLARLHEELVRIAAAAPDLTAEVVSDIRKSASALEPRAEQKQIPVRQAFEVVRPDDAHIYPYLVGGLLHDSLNTLWALQARAGSLAELARKGNPPDPLLQKISGQFDVHLEHLDRVLKLLQAISRDYYAKGEREPHSPKEALDAQTDTLRHAYATVQFAATVPGEIDGTQLPVGILVFVGGELMLNAARACEATGGGRVSMRFEVSTRDNTISLECLDTGPGFPAPLLEKLVEGQLRPPAKAGTGGYGLYLVREIVNRLHGTILFSNIPPHGARVQALLPARGQKQ